MITSLAQPSTELGRLVDRIRGIVASELPAAETSKAVAEALRVCLDSEHLVSEEHRVANVDHYQQHVMHVESDSSFSIVSLVWLPGQRTPIHDHVSWCVVGVYEGEEAEIQYKLKGAGEDRYLVKTGTSINAHGSTCGFAPPGDLHEVWNAGDGTAISIHVYGADIGKLGSSIRRQYDFPVKND